jgi:predicted aspartyl protease
MNVLSEKAISIKGIWDTGATGSVIAKSTAQAIGLSPIRKTTVRGVHGSRKVNVYFVNIKLHNQDIAIDAEVTECEDLTNDNSIGMLIGMNIITMGDFAVTNYQGQTVMTFRVPSLQKIDFVQGMRNGKQIIKDKIPGRNDDCPCGSGKKYKHCCGK